MPASDDTFYNIKRLHVVFALSATALLAATAWMVAADHFRSWKVYQRTYKDRIEPWLTEAELRRKETDAYRAADQKLAEALREARAAAPEAESIAEFCRQVRRQAAALAIDAEAEVARIERAYEAVAAAPGVAHRDALLERIDRVISAARLAEEKIDRRLQFRRAAFDEARSGYEAAVGQGLPEADLGRLERQADRTRDQVEELSAQSQRAAARRKALEAIRRRITRDEDLAQKALADHRAQVARLDRALVRQRPNLGKRLLRLPLVDAFGRPLSVDQIWLPELTIDYNFRRVARFDRCRTCHQAIGKTSPGSPDEPACRAEQVLTLQLATPSGGPGPKQDEPGHVRPPSLEAVYGLALAPEGMLDPEAATVGLVLPKSPAAMARLEVGDVIQKVGGRPIAGPADAARALLEDVAWGEPLELEIRRGLAQPYSAHPRLDLFVGSLSPHPAAEFGCTICHAGQGSATEFKYASHAPDDLSERARWRHEYGWFFNEFWDFPMLPARFAESGCLKCHHDVTDLEPSERFGDPPAAKLVAGYHLVRQNGCFGCHEIRGVTASGRRVGPDMRLEPNYAEAAEQMLADPALDDHQRSLARQVVETPEAAEPRRELVDLLQSEGASGGAEGGRKLPRETAAAVAVLAAEDSTPGTMRKVGPSLRHAAAKLDAAFLEDWIADPRHFRPGTRMPQFYGMHEHLEGKGLDDARRFEAVEVRAITAYLLAASQPLQRRKPPAGVTEPPSAERGKRLFQTQGCLACHAHADFPRARSTFGPDLTNLGAKLTGEAGRQWLVDWIRDPHRDSPRALMPNPLLKPVPLAEGDPPAGSEAEPPRMTDPAADIAAYLLRSAGWQPDPRPPLVESDLDALALTHLATTFPADEARRYLAEGIPESIADEVPADARELVGPITVRKKLRYVGRRTIRKRGCFGCHDIPGFEDAKLIGPELSSFGRKPESLLGFEQVHRFLAVSHAAAAGQHDAEDGADRAFFEQAVREHRREGFVWQKLRAPRSFDYKKTQNKGYNERLTMGRFTLTEAEREAIITFVLGLVADPPAEPYVDQPGGRRRAIVEGRKVLDKYGCAECHTLAMERWQFEYDPDTFQPPFALPDFDFLQPHFTAGQIAASRKTDNRGLCRAEVVGMPRVDASGQLVEDVDDDDNPLYFFTLWEPTLIGGQICTVGGADVMISAPQITGKRAPWGGAFARLLFPTVLQQARAAGSTAAEMEAFGWVPPPLVREGAMVQPAWLYDYLLDPYPIRPAAVLRMPKYNLSADEARTLVDYFAATAGADFPYTPAAGGRRATAAGDADMGRLDRAMRLLTDRVTFCAKCHLIGDYSPGDQIRTVLAPNLDQVGRRLRPDYLRRWLGNPKSALPYTGMPANFPPTGPPLGQDLLPGASVEQIEAVKDLLLDYDQYLKRHTSIRAMIESAERADPPAAGP